MGNSETKLNFRKAVIQLTTKSQGPIDSADDSFWEQFWCDNVITAQDVFTLIPGTEIRLLRDEASSNMATLCNKCVDKIVKCVENSCRTQEEQQAALNCCRLLTRMLPYIFERSDWHDFFWATVSDTEENARQPLAESLLSAVSDLLFCPDFTVASNRKSGPDKAEDLQAIDSCEYIWEKGVGFANSPPHYPAYDSARTELLKLLLVCFSETIYKPAADPHVRPNRWIKYFTSPENRHALPAFTSFLNTVCAYDPVGMGVPYNHLLFSDTLEPLVDVCAQILIVILDHDTSGPDDGVNQENLFINYLSRIHRDDDFNFIVRGFTRLLNNPLLQTYLPNSTKKISCHEELMVLFWKMCDFNKKFLYFVLKSSDVLEILVPILYHINDARADSSRIGTMHIGIFIILMLSGERNFGVRLNKPYTATVPMDIPVFTGTHADLLITVFHKIFTTGHQRLTPLFDCMLTILVNISPYLKTLSMVASTKLLHLLEAFSVPWYLFSNQSNHHLVFYLLEIFNNIIQYQFDGNSNLIYAIIRKRQVFHSLANLPTDHGSITKCLTTRRGNNVINDNNNGGDGSKNCGRGGGSGGGGGVSANALNRPPSPQSPSMEGSRPALPAEPGTLKATLPNTPAVANITKKKSPNDSNEASIGSNESLGSAMNDLKLSPPNKKDELYQWKASPEWIKSWKDKLPLQTIMRLLQVLVPQVEKICIDKGLTDETEILKFLQHGTLVGLLPVPHPILIRKYQTNLRTAAWFRNYMWGLIYLRNVDPPIWYDTNIVLFEITKC